MTSSPPDEGEGPFAFADLLRRLRLASGLSQEKLAERAGLSAAAITLYERGLRRAPRRHTVLQLADALRLADAARAEFEAAASRKRSRAASAPASPDRGSRFPRAGNGLPARVTTFVGRDRELRVLRTLLETARLVTITGAAGCGKTSLAVEAMAHTGPQPPGGVWFGDLALATSGIAARIADLLEVSDGEAPAVDRVAGAIGTRRMYLVLDNCEHVLPDVRAVVHALLARCPNLTLVCTSREALNLVGETVFRLMPMAVPAATAPVPPSEALLFESVALFVDRARAVNGHFALTSSNVTAVCEVCRSLDGLPLAIEIAASWMNAMSAVELAAGLGHRFRLLASKDTTRRPRQQTMEAAIAWSLALLPPSEQRLFERMSVFVGGCTLEAAANVCFDDIADSFEVLAALSSLVDKSLVSIDIVDEQTRYGQLESFRSYGHDAIRARGDRELRNLRSRHARYFMRKAEEAAACEDAGRQHRIADPLKADGANVRIAVVRSLDDGDARVAGAILAFRRRALAALGTTVEVLDLVERCCTALADQPAALAGALWAVHAAICGNASRLPDAEASATRAVLLARESGDDVLLFRILTQVSLVMLKLQDLVRAEEAVVEAERLPVPQGRPAVDSVNNLMARALVAQQTGRLTVARNLYRELAARPDFRSSADVSVWINLASLEQQDGNAAEAIELLEGVRRREGPALLREGARHLRASLLLTVAACYLDVGDVPAGLHAARDVLLAFGENPNDLYVTIAIDCVALAAASLQSGDSSAVLLGYADAACERERYRREPAERTMRDRAEELLRSIGPVERGALAGRGAAMSAEDARSSALDHIDRLLRKLAPSGHPGDP